MIGTNVKVLIQLERICWCLGEHPPNEFKKILETLDLIAFPPPPPPPPRDPPKQFTPHFKPGVDLSGSPIPAPPTFQIASCPNCSLRNAIFPNRIQTNINGLKYLNCQGCGTSIFV